MSDININETAMEVILHAGNGRLKIDEAFEKMAVFAFDEAEELLNQAEKEIVKAHVAQTSVIQSQVSGNEIEYSLLFIHAQDTIMTINTELRMTQKMLAVFRAAVAKKGE